MVCLKVLHIQNGINSLAQLLPQAAFLTAFGGTASVQFQSYASGPSTDCRRNNVECFVVNLTGAEQSFDLGIYNLRKY